MAKNIQNAFVVAGGLIEKDGKFLLVNAITGVPKGLWNIPAGRVDDGETIDEAAVREVKEETGFDTAIEGVIGVYHRLKNNYAGNMIRVNFKMRIIGGRLETPKDEIAEARWFMADEIRNMNDSEFAFGVKSCVLDYAERGMMKQTLYSTKDDVR